MNREIYDLSCYNVACGEIGRLQTLFTVPVEAGSTTSINMVGALRLSQLKRYLTLDCKYDLFAFFVPHRHVYANWETFLKEGMNTSETLATYDATAQVGNMEYLGGIKNSATVPAAYVTGYNQIWNEYFRIPNVGVSERADNSMASSTSETDYGYKVARLPAFWNTGSDNISATEAEVPGSAGSGAISLLDLSYQQASYQDEIDKDWFQHRYRDVLKQGWGATGINTDQDERAELLMHEEGWLSGYDVDGTSDASLGNYTGKSQGIVNFKMPPKYFNEHGMIWVMACLRFPSILQEEKHYLSTHTWTYENIAGDANLISVKPPHALTENDFHGEGGSNEWGTHPFGQWYRTQPNRVHKKFHDLEGYPFVAEAGLTLNAYIPQYDGDVWLASETEGVRSYFTNDDLAHWNIVSKAEIEKRSPVPNAATSINTGANIR